MMDAKGPNKNQSLRKINYGAWLRKVAVNEKIWAVKFDKIKFHSLKELFKIS